MSDDTDRLDRRTVLKALGTTAAVGSGLAAGTGSAAAARTARGLAGAYADEGALRGAFEQHGDDLRETLVAEGFVGDDFAFADLALDLDADVTGLDPAATDGLAGVTAVREDGTTTALGMVSTSSDTHDIALFVQPERGEAYARVTSGDDGDTYLVGGDGVTPEACSYTSCVNDGTCSSYCYVKKQYYSCNSNCDDCHIYNTDCSCCYYCDPEDC